MNDTSGILDSKGASTGGEPPEPHTPAEQPHAGGVMQDFIESLLERILFIRDITVMFFDFVTGLILLKGNQWKYTKNVVVHQLIFSGVDALYVVGIVSAIVGGVVMVQVFNYSSAFETDALLMQILVSLIVTEIAPILTALILVGRSGTAMTVELGGMRIKRQHEALETMGIDMYQYFYIPRIMGLAISTIILNFYFIFMTILAGIAISFFKPNLDMWSLLDLFTGSLLITDFAICIFKGAVLGMTIALVCIYHGTRVHSSATEIPQQTSGAVVTSFRLCWVINGVISFIWYAVS